MAYIFGSIWDRFNRNALNDLSKSVEQQGKSIQDLVAEGQLTMEQYAELLTIINSNLKSGEVGKSDLTPELWLEVNRISEKINKGEVKISDIDKNNFEIDQTMISDDLKQQIAGTAPINAVPADESLTTRKYVNKSVTTVKTDFAETASGSINLLDPNAVEHNKMINANDGTIVDVTSASGVSALISVKPNMFYCWSGINGRVVEYDSAGAIVKYQVNVNIIKTSNTTKFLRVYVELPSLTTYMLVEGSVLPQKYIPYKKENEIINMKLANKIDESNTSFLIRNSVNLFDKNKVIMDYRLKDDGVLEYNEQNAYILYLKVKPNTRYTVTEGSFVVQWNASKERVTGHKPGILSFTTSPTTEYLGMTFRKVILDEFMIVEGDNLPLTYQPYNLYKLKESIVSGVDDNLNPLAGAKLGFTGDSIVQNGDYLLGKIQSNLDLESVSNYGIGGTSYAVRGNPEWDNRNMVKRVADLDEDLDAVCILSGTNDFSNEIDLGDFDSRDETTFYGALHLTYEKLINRFPNSKLYVFTMPSRYNQLLPNSKGLTVFDYADAIIAVANHYSIPVYDTLRNSHLRFHNAQNRLELSKNDDGLHPNEKGYDLMLPGIINFLKYI